MEQGEPRSPKKPPDEPVEGAAGAPPAPERVDWTAILEQRALVPDSEDASPVAEPKTRALRPSSRRLLHLVVAVVALFSVVASAAVVMALWRGSRDDHAASVASAGASAPARAPRPMPITAAPQVTPLPPAAPAQPAPETPPVVAPPTAKAEPEPADDPQGAAAQARSREHAAAPTGSRPRSGSASKPDRPDKAEKPEKPEKPEKAERPEKPDKPDKPDKGSKGGSKESAPGDDESPSDSSLPAEPTAKDLASAVDKVKPAIATCAKENGVTGMVAVRMQIEPTGAVAWSAIREGGSEFQTCVGRVLAGIHLPKSQKGATLIHSITLPEP
ncbi:MAG TPA: hypothetical protein VKB80_25875 [Kofleriaceae bacterium]|nr:hypothetical protein [Kofleriaceae bacterium]